MHLVRFARFVAPLLGVLAATPALAQDTSIAYQGYFTNNGAVIPGPTNYTMTFRLYSAASGGTPLATISNQVVTVTDSLFATSLAFPSNVWTGADRWLEVQIGAQVLTPRQKIRWAPYAVYALTSGTGGGGVGGSGTVNQVPKWTAAATLGNSVITETSGNIGIGELLPLSRLHIQTAELGLLNEALENDEIIVEGTDAVLGLYSTNQGNWASAIALKEVSAGAIVDTWGIVRRTSNVSNPSSLHFTYGPSNNYTTNPAMMVLSNAGNVGIGLATPAQKLSVAGTIQSTTGGFMFPDGTTQTTASVWAVSGTNIFNSNSGNVGIGTNAPAAKLHVNGLTQIRTTANARRFEFQPAATNSIADLNMYLENGTTRTVNLSSGTHVTVPLANRGGYLNLFGTNGSLLAALGDIGPADGNYGYMGLHTSAGNRTILLESEGIDGAGQIFLNRANGTTRTISIYAADATGQGAAIDLRSGTGANRVIINAEEGPGRGADITLYNQAGAATIEIDADYGDTGVGRIRTQVLEITGADLAEQFPVSETIEPGMLVAIDAANEGKLCLARGAYNRAVAGVASGANDFSVGAILGSRPESEDGPPIALAGRVYVWVDADAAPVRPGDMLTTSDTPGHAMKVKDYVAAQGAIIGKAMGSLESGKGLVLVLVNLQ